MKLNFNEYYDKVKACWIGKNIGGTMGTPFEGMRQMNDIQGFTTEEGVILPNDDLDLQLVWLSAVEKLGLNRREANEFIVYWLPKMESNPYNIISFQTYIYTESAELMIDPAPDTLIRVFMVYKGSDEFVSLPVQELTAPERNGFSVVEWGGSELK